MITYTQSKSNYYEECLIIVTPSLSSPQSHDHFPQGKRYLSTHKTKVTFPIPKISYS